MRMRVRNRRLAALVAIGYLLGYLLVFVHFIAEQHAECAEHGGAHHVEVTDDAPGAPLAAGITAHPGAVDDHCHVLNAVRDPLSTTVGQHVSLHVALPGIELHATRLNLPPPRCTDVWRFAPKTSPPTHA